MSISRRTLLTTAVGVAVGCECPAVRVTAPPPEVRPRVKPRHLSVESTEYHGHPEASIHAQMINTILVQSAHYGMPICQMIIQPSLKGYEAALHLRRSDEGWSLVARNALVDLSEGLSRRLAKGMGPPIAFDELRHSVDETVRSISRSQAITLQKVWTEMLLQARPNAMPELDPDATRYSFAHHHLAGVTVWEDDESPAGRFVALGKALLQASMSLGQEYELALKDVDRSAQSLLDDLARLSDAGVDDSSWSKQRLYGTDDK